MKKDLDHWTDLYDAEMMQRETENMQLRNVLEQQREEHRELKEQVSQIKDFLGWVLLDSVSFKNGN